MLTKHSRNKKKAFFIVGLIVAAIVSALTAPSSAVFAGDEDEKGANTSAASEQDLEIKRAEWNSRRSELKIEGGYGVSGKTVIIGDAPSGQIFGLAEVSAGNRWSLKINDPDWIPCVVTATVDGALAEKSIKNAPGDCGLPEPPPPAEPTLEITRSEWNVNGPELIMGGTSSFIGQTITIQNANSGNALGTAIVGADESWLVHIIDPKPTPCRVSVSLGDLTDAQDVAGVPETCDGNSPPPPVVNLTGLAISGPDAVDEAGSANFVATASFSDGSSQNVTGQATWSAAPVSSGSINGPGVFTAALVDSDQTAAIIAEYTVDGFTASDEKTVSIIDIPEDPNLTGSHVGRFSSYQGSATCVDCHYPETLEVHGSVHYQWKGDTRNTTGLDENPAGKLGGINDFCIYPDINWLGKLTNVDGAQVDGGCAKCHVGMGAKPDPAVTDAQLANIDCLVCHSRDYERKVEMVDGQYRFVPAPEKMSVSVLQAAVDIVMPTKDNCLDCHTKSGGGNNYKRGDIEEAHRNPTRNFDVHMASAANGGAGLDCTDCHTTVAHRMEGRGTDLRPMDSDNELDCTKCHSSRPHDQSDINRHTARVNCTVCHIPTFAKVAGTDMERDWSVPGELDEAKRLFDPSHVKQTNVMPEYKFFNGKSYFYEFGDPATAGENGRIVMSSPEGTVQDPGARIHAFKHHLATQPIDSGNRLLPLKIGKFFETGNIAEAVELGAMAVWEKEYTGHDFADTERYMGLFHEVAPKEQALSCASCHYGGNRLDFASLGYTPEETRNGEPLCASCHSDKSREWSQSEFFDRVHSRHVDGRKYDCSACHVFSSAN